MAPEVLSISPSAAPSGRDLSDFFHYWVRGGFVPKVRLEYTKVPEDDGEVTILGCVTTDVPFGRFDLPVAIGTGKIKTDIDDPNDLQYVRIGGDPSTDASVLQQMGVGLGDSSTFSDCVSKAEKTES